MKLKNSNIIDLFINSVIVITTVLAVGAYFVTGPDILGSSGTACFKYFTTDSNVLAAIASLIMLFYNIKRIREPEFAVPRWLELLKFAGTASVALTFLTVLFFLAPMGFMRGGFKTFFFFFKGNVFVLHASTPILSVLSLTLFEPGCKFSLKDSFWALIPTIVYSLVYLVMVVFVRRWNDWYGFTFGGKPFMAPISMLAMYLVTLGIASVLRKLKRVEADNRIKVRK